MSNFCKHLHVIVLIAILCIIPICFAQKESVDSKDFPQLTGPYLGQKPPGRTPVKFAPEILKHTFCAVFSPDGNEFYFAAYDPDPVVDECSIVCMKRVDNKWLEPEVASFSSSYADFDICMSHDGQRVFFRSDRPLEGTGAARERSYLWFATRTAAGWSEAQAVAYSGRTDIPTGYPSITKDGTLYFGARIPGSVGPSDIYFSRLVDGAYTTPVNLGRQANSDYGEGDMFIAPDSSYLIVACYQHPENNGEQDLYISFRESDGSWTELTSMGELINTEYGENCPQVSPDGKWFFFNRYATEGLSEEGQGTHWVDAAIIESYRPKD